MFPLYTVANMGFAKRNWTPASILIVSKLVSSYGGELGIRTLGSFWEHDISSVLSIVEISRKSGAELEVGIPGKCSKIKCFWTSQRRQASRGKGSKNVRCSLRIWRQIGSLERKLERKEREQRATHTRLVLVKQMR